MEKMKRKLNSVMPEGNDKYKILDDNKIQTLVGLAGLMQDMYEN